jgi:hypothetical protein
MPRIDLDTTPFATAFVTVVASAVETWIHGGVR